MHPRSWKCLAFVTMFALFAAAALPAVAADDAKKAGSVDGNWTWSFTTQNGQTFETRAKLKQEGEKLTGVVIGRNNTETEIKDGKINEKGELSFSVSSERQGQTMTQKYTGKLEGDTIKGKVERERDGETRSTDWEAKRAKDEKPAA